jgi:protein-S-isoprenylcysteine O-methyltransferase Ste14
VGTSRARAAAGTVVFLIVAPGVVTGLVPWLITGWQQGTARPGWLAVAGAVLTAAGCLFLLFAFARFVREGAGTPAPPAPTERLVVGGIYRYVRNPMYLALQSIIVGQVLLLGRPALLPYSAAVLAATAAFTRWYEEPALRRQFGGQYEAYQREVPGWLPRLRPWAGEGNEPARPRS